MKTVTSLPGGFRRRSVPNTCVVVRRIDDEPDIGTVTPTVTSVPAVKATNRPRSQWAPSGSRATFDELAQRVDGRIPREDTISASDRALYEEVWARIDGRLPRHHEYGSALAEEIWGPIDARNGFLRK